MVYFLFFFSHEERCGEGLFYHNLEGTREESSGTINPPHKLNTEVNRTQYPKVFTLDDSVLFPYKMLKVGFSTFTSHLREGRSRKCRKSKKFVLVRSFRQDSMSY